MNDFVVKTKSMFDIDELPVYTCRSKWSYSKTNIQRFHVFVKVFLKKLRKSGKYGVVRDF